MRPTIFVNLVAALLLAGSAPALDYWPDDPDGLIYRYNSTDNGWVYDSVFEVDGDSQSMAWATGICHGSEQYAVDEKGVGLVGWYSYCEGGIDPGFGYYSPPLDIILDGMADGDLWVWEGDDGQGSCIVVVTVTAETITVPMGTFETLHVFLYYIACWSTQFIDYWLDRDLGPVRINSWELVSIEESVATEAQTWSEVKALYR